MPFSRRLPAIPAVLALALPPVTAAAGDPAPTVFLSGGGAIGLAAAGNNHALACRLVEALDILLCGLSNPRSENMPRSMTA